MFGETFQRSSSLSELQVKAYEVALADLSVDQLNQACEKTLRAWTLVAMPPPGFIRECVPSEPLSESCPAKPITSEERERQWESARAAGEKYRANIQERVLTIADLSKTVVKPEPVRVIATNERLELLARQKREIEAKYGGHT